MSLDKYKMIEGNEETAQELWQKHLPGYSAEQALPDNIKPGTDKDITITEGKQTSWMDNLFMKGREFKTYTWVTKEGIPIVTAIRGVLDKVILWAGLNGMHYRMVLREPDEGGLKTRARPSQVISLIQAAGSQNLPEKQMKFTPNPANRSQLIPIGMPHGLADDSQAIIDWVNSNYPELFRDETIQRKLDELGVKINPVSAVRIPNLDLVTEVGDWTLEKWNDYYHLCIPANSKVKDFLEDKGFILISQKDNEAADENLAQLQLSTQIDEAIKLSVLETLSNTKVSSNHGFYLRPPRGEPITKSLDMLRKGRKMEKWETILKLTTQNVTEGTLTQLKRTHPNVFISEIKPEDMKTTIMQFKNDAERHLANAGDNLELRRISMMLDTMLSDTEKLEELA